MRIVAIPTQVTFLVRIDINPWDFSGAVSTAGMALSAEFPAGRFLRQSESRID